MRAIFNPNHERLPARARHWSYYASRILGSVLPSFMALFALDVFDGQLGFWQTLFALFMHLIPSLVLFGLLVFACRYERVGGGIYIGLGVITAAMGISTSFPASFVLLTVIPVMIGGLFWWHAMWARRAMV